MATRTDMRLWRRIRVPASLPIRLKPSLGWATRHIRWKIIAPYAMLVVVLAAAGTYLATTLVTGPLEERFQNQLLQASRAASDSVVRREEGHLEIARSVAFTQGIGDAVREQDRTFVRGVIEAIAVNTASERIEVLDSAARPVAGVQLENRQDLTYTSVPAAGMTDGRPLVELALESESGEKFAQIIQTSAGPMLMSAAPIPGKDGNEGVVLVGTSLESIVQGLKGDALADVTLYDLEGNPIASTFVLDAASADLAVDPAVFAPDAAPRESREVWGRGYNFAYGDLILRDRRVGYFSVALASDFIFDASADTRTVMAIFFGSGMAAVLIVGFVLAAGFTRRIQELVRIAELVTAGDLSARTRVRSDDELGQLGISMNRMTDRLEGQYVATMRALASAVAGGNPYTLRHSFRVGQLATELGRWLRVDERTAAQLEIGGYLHDVGRIGIRDADLLQSDVISVEMKRFIRSHPHIGLEPEMTRIRRSVMDFIGREPERHGGHGGTPDDAPIVGRIVSVADLYDALTGDRGEAAERPLTSDEAMDILRNCAAQRFLHFGVVEALAQMLPAWERSQGRGSDYSHLLGKE